MNFKGSNYKDDLRLTDIAKIIRNELKKTGCKFSVVTEYHTTIYIHLLEAPFRIFEGEAKENHSINHNRIEQNSFLTEKAKDLFLNIGKFVQSYNYDNSEMVTDYFDTNFF